MKPQNPKKRTLNTVDEEPHPEDFVIFLQSAKTYESDYSGGEGNTVALIQIDIAKIEPLNMPFKIGNISTTPSWTPPGARVVFSIGLSSCK